MLHYFGLPYRHKGYRPDGTPLALCHNALLVDPAKELVQEVVESPTAVKCRSCAKYLAQALWALRNGGAAVAEKKALAQAPAGSLGEGVAVTVTRGAYAGGKGTIDKASQEAAGFWYVWLTVFRTSLTSFKTKETAQRVLLSEGQLALATT
jgi:hypothetical protein